VRQSRPFSRGAFDVISLARYAAVLQTRETRLTFALSVIGRLPIGITGLAVLLLVQGQTGSFARGGVATAGYVIGLAAVAPVLGRVFTANEEELGNDRVVVLGHALWRSRFGGQVGQPRFVGITGR